MGKFDISKYAAAIGQVAPAERNLDTITTEILQLKQDAGNAILGIGQRLIEAKAILSDGDWLNWLTDKVDFSPRTAQRFMRLAREWSDATALSHLGATKALTLLALPPEEREQFMSEYHIVDGEEKTVIDMTSRELEKAIRERDDARAAEASARASAQTAEESRAKMEQDMAVLKELHRSNQLAAEQAAAELQAAQEELNALRAKPVDVAVQTVVDQEAVDKARAEAIAEMQAKLEQAQEAQKTAEEKRKAAEKKLAEAQKQAGANAELMSRAEKSETALAEARRQLEAAEKAAKQSQVNADPDLAMFNVLFSQAQDQANRMHGLLLKIRSRDAEAGQKLQRAILALADLVRGCAE